MRDRLSYFFQSISDWVSYFIGTPSNIIFWIIALGVWTIVFQRGILGANNTNFLPTWFTSTAYNFPLNTVTTVLELFIGFFLAAAANRNDRNNKKTIANLEHMMMEQDQMIKILVKQSNTEVEELANIEKGFKKSRR